MLRLQIAAATAWGCADFVEVDPCGIIRITGWCQQETIQDLAVPGVFLDSSPVDFLQIYRTSRADIHPQSEQLAQAGLAIEYLLSDEQYQQVFSQLSVQFPDAPRFSFSGEFRFILPHYQGLLNSRAVLHREHIYGFGPPNTVFSADVLPLTRLLRGRVLDFGCGSGAMVRHLRSQGLDAHGLELNTDMIRNALHQAVRPYISLYGGQFPSPFPDKSFDCIYSSEVLEHIPNPEKAVAEMARLSTDRLVLTTPDISAIPVGFRAGLIPWHLLESTHVNFFTQTSLRALLEPFFQHIEFGRISPGRINESTYYVSLTAFCSGVRAS